MIDLNGVVKRFSKIESLFIHFQKFNTYHNKFQKIQMVLITLHNNLRNILMSLWLELQRTMPKRIFHKSGYDFRNLQIS